MASDNLLPAILGAVEGFKDTFVPYQQAIFSDALARRRTQQGLQDQLAVLPQKVAIEQAGAQQTNSLQLQQQQQIEQAKFGRESFVQNNNEIPPAALPLLGINAQNPSAVGMRKDFVAPTIAAAEAKDKGNITLGEKKDQRIQTRLTKLGEALDPSKQRAGAFGVSKQVFDRAERLQSLASAFKDGNLDSRNTEELAIGLNAMLSGSNTGAQAQVQALVPRSAMGNVKKLQEWLTNNPTGLEQQKFVERMLGSISREKATAGDQIKRTQYQRIGDFSDTQADPEGFKGVLRSHGVDPDEYNAWKKEGFKPMSAVQGDLPTMPNKKDNEDDPLGLFK